jgi:hypothetical protein
MDICIIDARDLLLRNRIKIPEKRGDEVTYLKNIVT